MSFPGATLPLTAPAPSGSSTVQAKEVPGISAVRVILVFPLWQIVVSVAIQIVTVIAVMWLAAKAFRMGMLMYGKPLTPRALWHALREGRTTLTVAHDEA